MLLALAILPIGLLILGLPIFMVLLSAVCVGVVFYMNVPPSVIHQTMFGAVNAYPLLAVPYFIFAGELMGRGSVAERLIGFVRAGVGASRGSVGLTAVGTATVFGAISGVSAATVATVGRIVHPQLRKVGYSAPFSAGLVTSVGAIGVIVPPSVPVLVYAAAAQQSVPRLYAAALLPGLLIAAMLAVLVVLAARRGRIDIGDAFQLRRFGRATARAIWALGAPVIVLGGIYGGVFSPTEAAAVACVYSAVVIRFVFREVGFAEILAAAISTVVLSSQILMIVATAGVFSWLLTVNQVPAYLVTMLEASQLSPWMLLLALNLLLLVVGCILDPISAILLLTPLLVPLVVAMGIDPIHFGIVMTFNLAIGLFTPPFGMNIFIAQAALNMDVRDIYRGLVPFFICFVIALALVTYVPAIAMTGPELFMRTN